MKILADEYLARDIVTWLRLRGHDVLYASEAGPGTSDRVWVTRAGNEARLLLTSDKDFGELVFRERLSGHGVVLLRLESLPVPEALARLQDVWSIIEANPAGKFLVITPKTIRVRDLATDEEAP